MISIEETLPSIMDHVIKYIYTGNVAISKDNLVDLTIAGQKFELAGLIGECFECFKNQNDFDNATDVLIMSEKHGLENFKKAALNKIIQNRGLLIGDRDFREKMLNHPEILLQLYDNLCQVTIPVNMTSKDLWLCICGSSGVGAFCSWCGNSYRD